MPNSDNIPNADSETTTTIAEIKITKNSLPAIIIGLAGGWVLSRVLFAFWRWLG